MDELKCKIELEYIRFKCSILEASREVIWRNINKIQFYCAFQEYFQYNDRIPSGVKRYLETVDIPILGGCWEIYLKCENLSIGTWEGITEILEKFIIRERNRYETCF